MKISRRSLLTKYFVSYIFIGIIPVFVFAVIYYYTVVANSNRDTLNKHRNSCIQVLNKIDYTLKEFSNISLHFSNFIHESLPKPNLTYIEFNKTLLMPLVQNYENSIPLPVEIAVYLRGDRNLYFSDGSLLYADFENRINNADLTMSRFFSIISSVKNPVSQPLVPREASPAHSQAFFVYPVPYLAMIPSATISFIISGQTLQTLMETYSDSLTANLYLYNENRERILQYEYEQLSAQELGKLEQTRGAGFFEFEAGRKDYVALRVISDSSGFSGLFIMRKNAFFREADAVKAIFRLTLILLAAIAAFLAAAFTIQNYRPIKKLLSNVYDAEHAEKNDTDELELIHRGLNDIQLKNSEYLLQLAHQRPLLVQSCLNRLLQGKKDDAALEYDLKCANIQLKKPYFFVLLIPGGALENNFDCANFAEECSLIVFPGIKLFTVQTAEQGNLAVICNSDETEAAKTDIRVKTAEIILQQLYSAGMTKGSIFSGRLYGSAEKISVSFAESCVAATEFPVTEEKKIVLFEELPSNIGHYTFPTIEYALFIQGLKQSNKDIVRQAIDNILLYIESKAEIQLITHCLCYDVINMLMRSAQNLQIELPLSDINSLCSFKNIPSFKETVTAISMRICETYEQNRTASGSKLKTDIINYIGSHFTDNTLSLAKLSDIFSLSQTYLSRFFKQETGFSYIQYITMLRMDWIKEQLAYTDTPIKDIITGAGYFDAANFMRKFKALEGVTPGQYREKMNA